MGRIKGIALEALVITLFDLVDLLICLRNGGEAGCTAPDES